MTFSLNDLTLFIVAITSLITVIRSFLNSKKLDAAILQIEIIHKATNSMKNELVEEVRLASHAQGVKDEKETASHLSQKV